MAKEETAETYPIQCPCCEAELIIDGKTRTVLHYAARVSAPPIEDLSVEVMRLQAAGAEREKAFQRSLEAETTREERMGRKFDELLRRAQQTPTGKPLKDIDL